MRNTILPSSLHLGFVVVSCLLFISLGVNMSAGRNSIDAGGATPSSVKAYTIRLRPGQDLKKELLDFAKREGIEAGSVVTCVGSLTDVCIRLANQQDSTSRRGHFEIVSLVGMLDSAGGHLHLSFADESGAAFGGHLMEGSLVYTTAEITICDLAELRFEREVDATFGYKELVVKRRRSVSTLR